MKIKPLLSCEVSVDNINFPIYVATKFDGVRALVIDSVVYSRSMKPIRNEYVQKLFGKPEYNGFDGELIVGDIYAKDVFQKMPEESCVGSHRLGRAWGAHRLRCTRATRANESPDRRQGLFTIANHWPA